MSAIGHSAVTFQTQPHVFDVYRLLGACMFLTVLARSQTNYIDNPILIPLCKNIIGLKALFTN